jgi:hypothetical protein
MENNFTNHKPTTTILEIPIPSKACSNLHLLKQLQIFIQHNNIPIQINTSSSSTPLQKGGSSNTEQDPEQDKKSKSLIYQSEITPFGIFKNVMDSFFLQKQHDNTEDKHNKQLLDSMFSKDKSKKEMIHSLQTLSEKQKQKQKQKQSREAGEEEKQEEKSEEKHQKKYISLTDTNTLYMHINTNHNNPIESIQGTKLYYLYQRQQNEQCAQFV